MIISSGIINSTINEFSAQVLPSVRQESSQRPRSDRLNLCPANHRLNGFLTPLLRLVWCDVRFSPLRLRIFHQELGSFENCDE